MARKHHNRKPAKPEPNPPRQPKPPRKSGPTNASELAEALGISRQLLSARRKKLGAAAPPLGDVSAWENVFATDGREGSGTPELRRKISEQRLRLLTAAASREETRDAKEREALLDKSIVASVTRQAMSQLQVDMLRFSENEGPVRLVGLDSLGVQAALTEEHNNWWTKFDAHIAKLNEDLKTTGETKAKA